MNTTEKEHPYGFLVSGPLGAARGVRKDAQPIGLRGDCPRAGVRVGGWWVGVEDHFREQFFLASVYYIFRK